MHDRLAPAALVVAVFAAPLLWAGCGGGSSDPASCTPVAESCNDVDDDCDGETDEAGAAGCTTYFEDADGDTYGASGASACLCVATAPFTLTAGGDCADGNPDVFPGAIESCNGVDDDCSGVIDQGIDGCCAPTESPKSCGVDLGVCTAGTSTCGPTFAWGACLDAGGLPVILASTELCDGLDNNCDGRTDEGIPAGAACDGNDEDLCDEGYLTCEGGQFVCSDLTDTNAELCDGVDNDCDGQTDEEIAGAACDGNDTDSCNEGTLICQSGLLVCSDATGNDAELCNAQDDDCDGSTDEDFKAGGTVTLTDLDGTAGRYLGQPCGTGACAGGVVNCSPNGLGLVCSSHFYASSESCNGVDDDCDGKTDETLIGDACPFQAGVCAGSRQSCTSGVWAACSAASYGPNYQASESACDGLDNDCDGTADEGSVETCNGIDDDCDGATDEGSATGCVTFWIDADGDGYGGSSSACFCTATGGYTATGGGDCNDTIASIRPSATEICDDVDNDCNEGVDEGCDDDDDNWCDSSMTVVGSPATCSAGRFDCSDFNAAISPGATELCANGIDDNCDGITDDPGCP